LLLVLLFIALWVLMLAIRYPMPYGFVVVLAVEAVTLAMFLAVLPLARQSLTLDRLHGVLLLCELGFHTAIVYFLGGLSWLGAIAYIYAVMYAAVFLSWKQAAAFTAAVVASFLAIVSLDGAGVIPHQWYLPQGPERFRDVEFLVTTCIAFSGVVSTVTFWMVFIGSEVRRERDEAWQSHSELVKAQRELWRLNQELEKKVEERTRVLAYRAEHDQLTGLLNRGAAYRRFRGLIALARRGGRPLSVVVADGDNFKSCNDRGGHGYGDIVLRTLADILKECARESDVVGRLGGDEFLVLLADTAGEGAEQFCMRVVKAVDARRGGWALSGRSDLPLPSLSMGVAVYPQHGADVETLLHVADRAMYGAKAEGGGRWKVGEAGATLERLSVETIATDDEFAAVDEADQAVS
jgi:diguanylate cyclase (GGDEF)-like protein